MKNKFKIIISMVIVLLLVSGCGCNKKAKEIDKNLKTNEELNEKLLSIKIKDSNIFKDLDILNDNTLETNLSIDRNMVEEHAVGMSIYGYSTKLYIIIKPKKGYEETIEKAVKIYIETAKERSSNKKIYDNLVKEKYNGYYIYLVSSDNEEVLKQIKQLLNS